MVRRAAAEHLRSFRDADWLQPDDPPDPTDGFDWPAWSAWEQAVRSAFVRFQAASAAWNAEHEHLDPDMAQAISPISVLPNIARRFDYWAPAIASPAACPPAGIA
jgi:hypothetical protein